MTRSPRWWRAIPLNDEPAEGNVDPANVDRSFLSPFLTQRPTIVLMYRQQWCLYRFKMWNKEQSKDMWPSSSTLWIDLMKEKVQRQCLLQSWWHRESITSLELHYSHSASLISAGHEGTMLPSSKRRQWGNGKKQGTTWWCHLVRDSQRQTTSDIVKFMTRRKLRLSTWPKQWNVQPMTTDETLV